MEGQLKFQNCELCDTQLGEDYCVLTVVDGKENRYYYCSPACVCAHFITYYFLMPHAANHMRDLLLRGGIKVTDKKVKGKNASTKPG
jgi:hypothetical protein